ncbi:MAG: UDP-N-acetylglucosamine 1-carboxyvinyltransferase [Candidatus Pacebacteria bacterium]|nr:UDP-N-acetylglucosamine 1-carboxyvinyltransferase [Candidatus Paceibacterota bacterium]
MPKCKFCFNIKKVKNMGEKFIIQGAKPLKGEISVVGAKNAAFPVLAASLLARKPCIIDNLPKILDVLNFIEIIKSLGAEVLWLDERKIQVRAENIQPKNLDKKLVSKLRGSVLLIGSLLANFKEIEMPQPGGCLIGARPITTHLDAFSQLKVEIIPKEESFLFLRPEKEEEERAVILNEFSVTATENILLYLATSQKETVIKCADGDYPVQELIKVLRKMGVEIEVLDAHTYKIRGKKELEGFEHKLMYDPIEAGTFILMAAATKGEIIVKNVEFKFLELALKRLKNFGLPFERIDKSTLKVKSWSNLKVDKVQALPYPGIPTDLLPLFGVLATQTEGLTLLHDPLYENRLKYLEELNKMGAQIIFADPHRAIVNGQTPLFGIEVSSPDIRGGVSLIAGALIAKGETIINNVYQIDRGYERIEERLQRIGAKIDRLTD